MGCGKIASQVGHGVQAIVADCERAIASGTKISPRLLAYAGWSLSPTKVVLKASQEEMEELLASQEDEAFPVYDENATTQVPSGSFTVLAFYPRPTSEGDEFKTFKLLD